MLWEKGVLGFHSHQTLVDTMVFIAGLYFALRSGDEHRWLTFSFIRLVEKPGCDPCLVYAEVENKQVTHYAKSERPDWCFVQLYKKYCSHLPAEVTGDVFYSSLLSVVWYNWTYHIQTAL